MYSFIALLQFRYVGLWDDISIAFQNTVSVEEAIFVWIHSLQVDMQQSLTMLLQHVRIFFPQIL